MEGFDLETKAQTKKRTTEAERLKKAEADLATRREKFETAEEIAKTKLYLKRLNEKKRGKK
jgi:hypothetical protein